MSRWFSLKIPQQFLLFLTATCILPLGLLCLFFFQSLDAKFSERLSRMLDIGLLFAEQVQQKNLEKLSLSTTEAASFYVRRDYQAFSHTGDIQALQSILNKYFELRNLDVLNLYDASGNTVAHAQSFKPLFPDSFARLIREAHRGRTASSVELLSFPAKAGQKAQIKLEYVAVAPIYSQDGPKRLTGIFLTGESLSQNPSFYEFVNTLPEIDLRIYAQTDPHSKVYNLLYTSISGASKTLPVGVRQLVIKAPHRIFSKMDSTASFSEKIGRERIRSKAVIFKNFANDDAMILVVSTMEKDLMELKQRNIEVAVFCLLCILALIGLAGFWFKRMFIDPVETLANAAEEVAEGNLDVVVPERFAQREIRNTIHSFNHMTKQLQEDQRIRSTFISTLTHDLRTPLIAQKRVLEIYEEFSNELPAEMKPLNHGLLKSNNHLLEMVNKLLETYQYEAGKIVLLNEPVNLHDLVQDCIHGMESLSLQKHISIENRISASLPPGDWDRNQLQRVFQNLLSNAVANIQEGKTIALEAHVLDRQQPRPLAAKQWMEIHVSDNGPGIQADVLPLLFTRYFTGDRRRQKIGSGLGLYICRMIIELHGGKIEVTSMPGQGTTFIIALPLKPDAPRPDGIVSEGIHS